MIKHKVRPCFSSVFSVFEKPQWHVKCGSGHRCSYWVEGARHALKLLQRSRLREFTACRLPAFMSSLHSPISLKAKKPQKYIFEKNEPSIPPSLSFFKHFLHIARQRCQTLGCGAFAHPTHLQTLFCSCSHCVHTQ